MSDFQTQLDQARERIDMLSARMTAIEATFSVVTDKLGHLERQMAKTLSELGHRRKWQIFMVTLLGGQFVTSVVGLVRLFQIG